MCSYLNFYKYFLCFELLDSNAIKNESIHLNSWHHSYKKQKDNLKTWMVLLILSLELEISGVVVREYLKTAKNGDFCEEQLSDNDIDAVQPVSFVMNNMVSMLLKQFRKSLQIKKNYRKCSSCVIVCWIVKIYQSITVRKGQLLGHLCRS